jgi:hypothetical protein
VSWFSFVRSSITFSNTVRSSLRLSSAVLREVAGDDVAAEVARAALDGDDAGEDLEQRGLAGAVGADEHDALAALGLEVEIAIDDVVAVGLLDVLELTTLRPERGGWGNLKLMRADPPSGSSTATSFRRSICFSFDLAREAIEALAPKRSTNFWRWAISRCWFLNCGGLLRLAGDLLVRGSRRSCRCSG